MTHRRRPPSRPRWVWLGPWVALAAVVAALVWVMLPDPQAPPQALATDYRSPDWPHNTAAPSPTKPAPRASATWKPSPKPSPPRTTMPPKPKPTPKPTLPPPPTAAPSTPKTSTPAAPAPTASPKPTVSATEQLRILVGLPRYTGMDSYAQELADTGKLDSGPYAKAISATAESASEAYYLMRGNDLSHYTRCGIGLHNDYWILVLS